MVYDSDRGEGRGMKCLICGGEMNMAESFASVVPASDDYEYWRCRSCGLDIIPEVNGFGLTWRGEGFGPGRWKRVTEGCLLVIGGAN